MIAIGHGPLRSRACTARRATTRRPRTGSSRPTSRSSTTRAAATSSLGSGIAAVNEWANCVDAGAQCIALRRNPHPEEQDLNVPRCLFDGSGIDAFQGLSFDQRVDFIGKVLRGTAPTAQLGGEGEGGHREGRFEEVDRERHRHPARPGWASASSSSPTSRRRR